MKNVYRILAFFVLSLLLASFQVGAENKSGSLKAAVSDSVITTKIKSQFVANDTTKATSITVETNNGVVKLSGVVDSQEEADTAVQIAASTVGVKDIDSDNLYVRNNNGQQNTAPLQDSYITAKIKGVFMREKLLGESNLPVTQIKVETQNGIVTLSGDVENSHQAKKATNLAKSVKGVKEVISKLNVKSSD